MRGLDPRIHRKSKSLLKTRIAGSSLVKPGNDGYLT
jgi:hypothetical protein